MLCNTTTPHKNNSVLPIVCIILSQFQDDFLRQTTMTLS